MLPKKKKYFFFHSLEKTKIDYDPFLTDDLHNTFPHILKEKQSFIFIKENPVWERIALVYLKDIYTLLKRRYQIAEIEFCFTFL